MDNSHHFDEVTRQLAQWQRRRLWSDALLWLPRGLLAGLVAAAAVAALARFRPILHNREVAYLALAMASLGLLLSLMALLLRKHSLLDRARFFDRLFELKERASTTVEIRAGLLSATPILAGEQLADTAKAMAQVDAESGLPLKLRWTDLIMILAAGILLLLAVIMPNDQASILEEEQVVAETIAGEIVALQALDQQIQNDPLLDDAGREELLAPIRIAIDELNAGQLSREEAVAVLSEAEADLRELGESGNAEALSGSLQSAGQPLSQDMLTASMGQALGVGDLARAAAATSQLAQDLDQLPASASEDLARNLMETAAALAAVDPTLSAELADAAQALQNGDVEGSRDALQSAAATMQQRAQEQAVATGAQAAAEALQSAREEVAAAGESSDYSPQDGAGQGASEGSGSGQSVDNAGSGQAAGQGAGSATQEGQGAGGPGPGGGHADTVFVPDYIDLSAESGEVIELPAECIANPASCGALISESPTDFTDEQSLVPYSQVFGDYRDAAIEALEGDYVPLGMKGLIRDYFSTLEP